MQRFATLLITGFAAMAADAPAQGSKATPTKAAQASASQDRPGARPGGAAKAQIEEPRIPAVLDYKRDRGLPIAVLDGRVLRLQDLATKLQASYDPGVVARWSDADGSLSLNSTNLPQLVWQFVDVEMLTAEAKARGRAIAEVPQRVDALLEKGFKAYLARSEAQRARVGHKALTEREKAQYRARHRRENGLFAELQVLLELIIPPKYTQSQLREWHYEHGDWFGGQVKFGHIFLRTREKNGRLKPEKERARLEKLAWRIYERLDDDSTNFGELARKHGEDRVSKRGGEFEAWTRRDNNKLPSALVRTAWELKDGDVSRPVQSYYGIHVVKRFKRVVHKYLLLSGKTILKISHMKARDDHETFLAEARRRHSIRRFL